MDIKFPIILPCFQQIIRLPTGQSGCILMYFINAFKKSIESTWQSIQIVIMHKKITV